MSQGTIKGNLSDGNTGEELIGATIKVKDQSIGCVTDIFGNFELSIDLPLPITLEFSYVGYQNAELTISSFATPINFRLAASSELLETFEVRAISISQKQKESALTVESMGVREVTETPAVTFYEGLGALKGVDLTSASLGFKIINTRGFNSTSPVRSLQVIDGVDNQAPGLNFSLGNFVGAPDLDVLKVDIIVGASSAFYGPNAFNGVIDMKTKDPYIFQGLTATVKTGERNLMEAAVRYAHAFKKDNRETWAYKFNFHVMKAYDWVADNDDPVYNTTHDSSNWGGYDAVNTYGDEQPSYFDSKSNQVNFPGLGVLYRNGYKEKDIVDYNTFNLKTGLAIHRKFKDDSRIIVSSNFGTGTTVYQGDNRYSLKDILFFQNRLEYNSNKGFVRVFATHEDAGNSYDAVFTALLMQREAKDIGRWAADYGYYWASKYAPKVKALPGFPSPQIINGQVVYDFEQANAVMAENADSLQAWHDQARILANLGVSPPGNFTYDGNFDLPEPGTQAFDSLLTLVSTRTSFQEGGAAFFDKSSLYHAHAERNFNLDSALNFPLLLTVGASYRMYRPFSKGTIFRDTTDTIINHEAGAYLGLEKKFMHDRLKINLTSRVDKNQNFPFIFTPAASAVYNVNEDNVFRLSFSSASRNPTLLDQYMYYNTGRAILLGNISGYDSLVTVESAQVLTSTRNPEDLVYFNVAPVVPEKVKSFELGFRSLIDNSVYLDLSYYYSIYNDFIGYNIGIDAVLDPNTNLFNPAKTKIYRIAANATDVVTTQGASIGINYYFEKFVKLHANYSWNVLNEKNVDDPIIPAFNTPEHKYNIGITVRDYFKNFSFSKSDSAKIYKIKDVSCAINYKWVQGFLYEGSPQFTGEVPSYDIIDAQISKYVEKWKATFKLGASNLLNKKQYQVYGGPRVGRLMYFSVVVDLKDV